MDGYLIRVLDSDKEVLAQVASHGNSHHEALDKAIKENSISVPEDQELEAHIADSGGVVVVVRMYRAF